MQELGGWVCNARDAMPLSSSIVRGILLVNRIGADKIPNRGSPLDSRTPPWSCTRQDRASRGHRPIVHLDAGCLRLLDHSASPLQIIVLLIETMLSSNACRRACCPFGRRSIIIAAMLWPARLYLSFPPSLHQFIRSITPSIHPLTIHPLSKFLPSISRLTRASEFQRVSPYQITTKLTRRRRRLDSVYSWS